MPRRFAGVLGLRSEKIAEYKAIHAAVWPSILLNLRECNIQNYSIFLRQLPDGKHYLFSYMEYTGTDLAGDMRKMSESAETKRWWAVCGPCQEPFADRAKGEWWASMEEVFHQE